MQVGHVVHPQTTRSPAPQASTRQFGTQYQVECIEQFPNTLYAQTVRKLCYMGAAPPSRYMWPHATRVEGLVLLEHCCPQRSKGAGVPAGSATSSVRLPAQAHIPRSQRWPPFLSIATLGLFFTLSIGSKRLHAMVKYCHSQNRPHASPFKADVQLGTFGMACLSWQLLSCWCR